MTKCSGVTPPPHLDVSVIVHLDGNAAHGIQVDGIMTKTSMCWVLAESIRLYAEAYTATDLPAISGLYDMASGQVVDLASTVAPDNQVDGLLLQYGAIRLQENGRRHRHDESATKLVNHAAEKDGFRQFVKTIQSSLDKAKLRSNSFSRFKLLTTPQQPPLIATPTQTSTLVDNDLCPATDTNVDDVAQGTKPIEASFLTKTASCQASSYDSSRAELEGSVADLVDSPAFRRALQCMDDEASSIQGGVQNMVGAVKAVAHASHVFLATLQSLKQAINALTTQANHPTALMQDRAPSWRAHVKTTLDPCCQRLDALASTLISMFHAHEVEFVRPWDDFASEYLGLARIQRRDALNMRFAQHHSLALAYAAMPVDESQVVAEGQDRVLAATHAAFETARREVVRQFHDMTHEIRRVALATSRAFAGPDTTVEDAHDDLVIAHSLPSRPVGVDNTTSSINTGAMGGYLFQVAMRQPVARTRRWVYIQDGALYAATDDLHHAEPELVADLACATVVRCHDATVSSLVRRLRHGFQVLSSENNGVATSTWQADTRDELDRWIAALAAHEFPSRLAANASPPSSPVRPPHSPPSISPTPSSARQDVALCSHPREASADEFHDVVRHVLPCSVATYLNAFVVDPAFSTAYLVEQRATAIEFSPWMSDERFQDHDASMRYSRRRSCVLPIDTALSQGSTRIQASDMYQVAGDLTTLRLISSDVSLDVPYGSYFEVQSRTTVRTVAGQTADEPCCQVVVELGVYFSRRTMFRRMIEHACLSEAKKSYDALTHRMVAALGSPAVTSTP